MSIASVKKISNVDVAMIALYRLGGVKSKVHLEEITAECYALAAGRFAWELQKYKKYPDKRAVFYALADARKEKAGSLVESFGGRASGGEKFQITMNGVRWIKGNEDRIVRQLKVASSVAPKQDIQRILRALKDEPAVKKFRDNGMASISIYDLVNFLGCAFETSPSAIRKKFADMRLKAELVEDSDILDFLCACEKNAQFADLLHTEKESSHD